MGEVSTVPELAIDPEKIAKEIQRMKMMILISDGGTVVLTPCAEYTYLAAIALLEQAAAQFQVAHFLRLRDM